MQCNVGALTEHVLTAVLFLLAFVCTIWWVFALQRHLKEQLYFPESLRSSLYGQVFVMLGIELLQRKQSFSFFDNGKQHTLCMFFPDIFVILIMLSVLLRCGVPKAWWLENLVWNSNQEFLSFHYCREKLEKKMHVENKYQNGKKEPKVMSQSDAILWHRD